MLYLKYLKYLLRHKYFVFIECFKLGIPWLGLIHDWSKFLPDEFIPYARNFYGERTESVKSDFDIAWLNHVHRNKHHWMHWIVNYDNGKTKTIQMPDHYMKEMLADWRGTGRAKGKGDDTALWYATHADMMQLHQLTRAWVESVLGSMRL